MLQTRVRKCQQEEMRTMLLIACCGGVGVLVRVRESSGRRIRNHLPQVGDHSAKVEERKGEGRAAGPELWRDLLCDGG